MNQSYLKIWTFLEGKLSPKEEVELMEWIDESVRNTLFFDQVVDDFNEINKPSPARGTNYKWYGIAASILLFIAFSIWLSVQFKPDPSLQRFSLHDGSQIILNSKSKFEYDSLSFESTKWIKIQGTAEIQTIKEEHLLIETQNGYLMLDGNSTLQIQELKHNEMKVFVERGSMRWLNPEVTSEELALVSGQNMVFKNDGKTVLLNNRDESKKSFIIFDNFMNL